MPDETRSHAATVELNRGMKGEYSIRVVARDDDDDEARERALASLRLTELQLGISATWHAAYDEATRLDFDAAVFDAPAVPDE